MDEDKYIEAKVYFKPKKLSENGKLEFRPLHSTDLITQIAIVSMLHLFVYEIPEEEEGDPKLRLSNLSRLIPSDFYGNRVSVKPEYLFKPWKQQYQKYKAYASAYEMTFAYYDLVMDEGIFIEEQTYVMLMNFFAHCEKILRINLNPENWKDMKWDEIIDNQINEENKITCHLRNKIRSC